MPRLTITLTPDQVSELDDLIAHAQQPEVRRRTQIIRLLHAGYTPTYLAGELGISRKTVYNVAHTFELHGIDGLYDRHRSGRPGRADDHYRAVLEDTLALLPRDLGYSNLGWTAGLIREHMTRETGVTLSLSHLKALLHDMGYEYKRQPPYITRLLPSRQENRELLAAWRILERELEETLPEWMVQPTFSWVKCRPEQSSEGFRGV
jgi:transposase